MGIKGLLPSLEHAKVPIELAQLKGKRIAIDGHCWLHNGLTCCAYELELGIPTDKYITSFRNKLIQLLNCGVIPVIVFDGQSLPLKADTAGQREKRRNEARARGFQHISKGNRKAAFEEFRSSAKITPIMINNVIKMLNSFKVEHIIAPYEADPQLAHLCRSGYVNAVLTMDSDLLAFDCPHIIFQRYNFETLFYVQYNSLFTEIPDKKDLLNLTSFTPTTFRQLCILSGCDYVENMPRFGMKSAYKYLKNRTKVEQIVRSHLGNSEKATEYMSRFHIAEAGFLYQIVYDPSSKSCVRLNPLPDNLTLTEAELALLGIMPTMKGHITVDLVQEEKWEEKEIDGKEKEAKEKEAEENKANEEPAVVPDTKESVPIIDLTNNAEEEEEEICPSLSTTKDDDEEEEILSTPVEPKLLLSNNINSSKSKKTPLQDATNDNSNKMTAQELASSFQQKNTSSFIRQKSVLGSLKKIQSSNSHQTTLQDFFNYHQKEKKRKLEEIKENNKKGNETLHSLFNNTKRRSGFNSHFH